MFLRNGRIHLVYFDGSEIEVITYGMDLAEESRAVVKSPFPASSVAGSFTCEASHNSRLVCAVGGDGQLHHLDLAGGKQFVSQSLASLGLADPDVGTLQLSGRVMQIDTERGVAQLDVGENIAAKLDGKSKATGRVLLGQCGDVVVRQECSVEGVDAAGVKYCSEFSGKLDVGGAVVELDQPRGGARQVWTLCEGHNEWQAVIKMSDASLVSVTPRGSVMWVRDEALATVHTVAMVNPGQQGFVNPNILHQHSFDPASLLENFLGRVKRHVAAMQRYFASLAKYKIFDDGSFDQADRFGLRKVIVAVTNFSKMYGLDSRTGRILWQISFPGTLMVSRGTGQLKAFLHVMRDARSGATPQVL